MDQFGDSDMDRTYYGVLKKGVRASVIKSLLQKAIRRNDLVLADYAAAMMLGSNQAENLWTRLLTIASEDIGPANNCAIEFAFDEYKKYCITRMSMTTDKRGWTRIRNLDSIRLSVHRTVDILCRSPKSRIVDCACVGIVSPVDLEISRGKIIEVTHPKKIIDFIKEGNITKVLQAMSPGIRNNKYVGNVLHQMEKYIFPSESGDKLSVIKMLKHVIDEMSSAKKHTVLQTIHLMLVILSQTIFYDKETVASLESDQEMISRLQKLYEEICDDSIPKRKIPEYVFDLHVKGYTPGSVEEFIKSEEKCLSPIGSIKNQYLELALDHGVIARETLFGDKKKARLEKAKLTRLANIDKKNKKSLIITKKRVVCGDKDRNYKRKKKKRHS